LEFATAIRLVLTELSERIANALKENAEIEGAITKLLHRKQKLAETDT